MNDRNERRRRILIGDLSYAKARLHEAKIEVEHHLSSAATWNNRLKHWEEQVSELNRRVFTHEQNPL